MKGATLALGSVAALALGAAARSRAGSFSWRDDLPDPRGVLENPRDPGSTGRVERKIRKTGYGPKIDLVGSVTPRGDRFSSGEVRATRVDDLSLLAPEARAVIARIGERRGSPVERAYVVHTANIEPGGVGWGQVLYQAMAMRAAEENAVLVSHACTPSGITSNDAENMWEKLGRSILVEQVDMSEADEEAFYDGPCFVAWGEPVGSFARSGGSRSLAAPVSPYFRQGAQEIRVYRGTRGTCGLCPDSRGVTYWTDDPVVADRYAGGKPGRVVHAGHLHLHNPYVLETDAAARQLAGWLDAARGITRDLDDDPWWHDYFRVVDQEYMPKVLAARGYDSIRFMDVIDQSNHVAWAIWNSRKFVPG